MLDLLSGEGRGASINPADYADRKQSGTLVDLAPRELRGIVTRAA